MRYVLAGLMSAALLLGCSDDDDPSPSNDAGNDGGKPTADAGNLDAGNGGGKDASTMDSGNTSLDAGRDAATPSDASSDASTATTASATLASKSGTSTTGRATFAVSGGRVTLTLTVSGAVAGQRGAHIHAIGDCSADNASSAGGHWNPETHPHGSGGPDAGEISHLGDLGNITIGSDGTGTLTYSNPEWKLGDGSTYDVVGKAVIVHANTDDFVTQQNDAGATPGNAGGRIACGVITK